MASETLTTSEQFPVGTSVAAFPRDAMMPGRAPSGTATTTATVAAGGSLTFTGLAEEKRYTAYALVGSEHRYVGFTTYSRVSDLPVPDAEWLTRIEDLEEDVLSVESSGAVLRESPLNVRDERFGAVGDGVTDDTAAIQAALDLAATAPSGGEVLVPSGATYIAHGLSLEDIAQVSLLGEGDARQSGSRILSHSTGSTAVVKAGSASGARIEGLRIENDQATFTGKILDLDRAAGGSRDTALVVVSGNALWAVSQAASAVDLLTLDDSYGISVERNRFFGGRYGVRGRSGATKFSQAQVLRENLFELQDGMAIRNPGNMWMVEANTFEPLRSGAPGAVSVDTAVPADMLTFLGNWTGDSSAVGQWIAYAGVGLTCIGNLFDTYTGGDAIRALASIAGLTVVGNRFNGGQNGINLNGFGMSQTHIAGNRYTSVTVPINGNSFGAGSLVVDSDGYISRVDANTLQIGNNLSLNSPVNSVIYQQAIPAGGSPVHQARVTGAADDTYILRGDGTIERGLGASTPTVKFVVGAGSPEGVVTAGIGSIYQRTNGGAATSMYVKESGAGNTGWVAK